jgi:hypothetical protein
MSKRETAEEAHERGYIEGRTFSDTARLHEVLQSLSGIAPDEDPLVRLAHATLELRDTRAALRILCREHGSNDWDDNLYLADVVEKHLGRYLDDE